jgi:hypothetical protein
MADKTGAYATKAADTDFRKKWDKEEYAERAKKKDQEEKERMQENEERMKQGSFSLPPFAEQSSHILYKESGLGSLDERTCPSLRNS